MNTFKQFLTENRVVTNIRLTTNQKQVLAIMMATPDLSAHDDEISKTPNMSSARKLLTKLKLIEPTDGDKFVVTQLGQEIADEEGVSSGATLTDAGQELASKEASKSPSGRPANKGPSDEGSGMDMAVPAVPETAGNDTLPESNQTFKTFIS